VRADQGALDSSLARRCRLGSCHQAARVGLSSRLRSLVAVRRSRPLLWLRACFCLCSFLLCQQCPPMKRVPRGQTRSSGLPACSAMPLRQQPPGCRSWTFISSLRSGSSPSVKASMSALRSSLPLLFPALPAVAQQFRGAAKANRGALDSLLARRCHFGSYYQAAGVGLFFSSSKSGSSPSVKASASDCSSLLLLFAALPAVLPAVPPT